MQYMGSKRRIAKFILPLILADRSPGQWYIEPFVGGANSFCEVDGNRCGIDTHFELIALLTAIRDGWTPPTEVSEDLYRDVKEHRTDKYAPELVGFVGFLCSFGSKYFGGYAKNKRGDSYAAIGVRSLAKLAPKLSGSHFMHASYTDVPMPAEPSIIYCDPPYASTTKYSTGAFDHAAFYAWCRSLAEDGHKVFVSEYAMPDSFECVWEKTVEVNFDSTRKKGGSRVERLFIPK